MNLYRRLASEALGACLLRATVIGSGILAVALSGGNDGVALLGNTAATAAIVALVIAAGYWWTSSTSFANPAITLARSLTDSFAGIRMKDAPGFIGGQPAGADLTWIPGGWVFGRKSA